MEHLEAIFGRLNHVRFGEDQRQESFELAELLESIRIQPAEVNFVLEVE